MSSQFSDSQIRAKDLAASQRRTLPGRCKPLTSAFVFEPYSETEAVSDLSSAANAVSRNPVQFVAPVQCLEEHSASGCWTAA
jgi:hypothetical protein